VDLGSLGSIDTNGDDVIDFSDLNVFLSAFNTVC
jgi:hypothetical protein